MKAISIKRKKSGALIGFPVFFIILYFATLIYGKINNDKDNGQNSIDSSQTVKYVHKRTLDLTDDDTKVYVLKENYKAPVVFTKSDLYVWVKENNEWSGKKLWKVNKDFPFPPSNKRTKMAFQTMKGHTETITITQKK